MKKIILAFDSFKGSVSSEEIAVALDRAIRKDFPGITVRTFRIADGGEGTTEALCSSLNASRTTCWAHDALMRPITATYAIAEDGRTALIEVAAAAGLSLLNGRERNPLHTTTYGVGEIVKDALSKGCREMILGLGGSATNDAGTGMLSALGVKFFTAEGEEISPSGGRLSAISSIDTSLLLPELSETSFRILSDVDNPFCGREGAAYIFAPQKGAGGKEVVLLDNGLHRYGELILKTTGTDIFHLPGAGAAGGMGGGLLPFLRAELLPGSKTILEILHFREAIKGASLILTGEGKIDRQTVRGKALKGIVDIAREENVPVAALCGAVADTEELNGAGFAAIFSVQSSPVTWKRAMRRDIVLGNLSRTARQIIRLMFYKEWTNPGNRS
ncbi:glycerate kinase [Phocaeicola abscessus]|uniref:glycerate kinase family protein n=1 Tax=Phocaeicola abscessus TaxID=555313 RepID=UPI0028E8013E|nr:glycerate kinase [Phocaeicola abscessus]